MIRIPSLSSCFSFPSFTVPAHLSAVYQMSSVKTTHARARAFV